MSHYCIMVRCLNCLYEDRIAIPTGTFVPSYLEEYRPPCDNCRCEAGRFVVGL